ncbi:MAG: hypothetical protein ACRERE_01605 [Candidatus Entotheonellia bacterium]
MHFSRDGNTVIITGANLQIVNGVGQTSCEDNLGNPIPGCPNGLGNLLVGYNEPRDPSFPGVPGETIRTGSHNVVVGRFHNFAGVGGLVAGELNEILGDFAAVSGDSRTRPVAASRRSVGASTTWPAGTRRGPPAGSSTPPAGTAPRSVRGLPTRLVVFTPRSVAGPRTRRAGRAPPSAAGCSGPLQD